MYALIYMWNLKSNNNKSHTHRGREKARGWGWGGGKGYWPKGPNFQLKDE